MNPILKYTGIFFIYLILQVLLFNHLTLAETATPHVFLAFLLMLPPNLNFALTLVIAFAAGLLVDLFSINLVYGAHAFACVLMMGVRNAWISVITNRVAFRGNEEYMLHVQPFPWYVNYLMPMIIVHHLAYFILEAFGFQNFPITLSRIVFSGIFTFVWVFLLIMLFHKSNRR